MYLLPGEQRDKLVDMSLRDSVYNLTVVFDQLHCHLGSLETNVTLKHDIKIDSSVDTNINFNGSDITMLLAMRTIITKIQ